MKSLFTIIFFLCFLLPGKSWTQCPVAGSDSSVTYCRHEVFDLSGLLSADANSGGVFISPGGDTLSPPMDSLFLPGIYTYRYIVSDTACENDTATFYVTIEICPTGGMNELLNESNLLIYPNPAIDHLALSSTDADVLLIYDEHGKCVYRRIAPLASTIDISEFDPGLYLLILQRDVTGSFQRFLKIEAP